MTRPAGSAKLLRALNESAALAHLLDPGGLTRADLRRLTALSTPTISEVLRRLTEADLVTVVGTARGGRPGPNAEIYSANPDAAYTVAVSVRDVGTSDAPSLGAALGDLTGTVRARTETGVDFLRTDPVTALADVVARLAAGAGVRADRIRHVQLGVAGSYDAAAQTIRHVDVPGFGRPGLVTEITRRLGVPVAIDNDVNLAAVAERRRGAARDTPDFALLWLGAQGLGLAIDIGGTLLRGARGGAGEIGYLPLFSPGSGISPDSTYRKVDLQDVVGGTAVVALARDHGVPGRTAVEVVSNAVAGHHGLFLTRFAERVAVGLAVVTAVLDPSLVVLAGEVGQAGGQHLRAAVAAAITRATPLSTTLAVTTITDDAVLLGALDAGLHVVREALIEGVGG